jgi:GNAT superfamily N-acetyltransferase
MQSKRPMASAPPGWFPRYYRPEDDEQIVELLQASFDGWPKVEVAASPLDHLRWKLASPVNAWRQNIVGEAAGRLISTRLYVLRDSSVCGRPMICKLGLETCVHPDYRNAGVMSVIQDYADERLQEIDVHLLYSQHPALLHIRKRQTVVPFRRIISLVRTADAAPEATAPTAWTIEERPSFDSRIDVLFDRAKQEFALLLDRKQQFMNWRYCDPRGGAFSIKTAEQDGHFLGYIVTTIAHGEGYIADLLALPGRLDIVDSLVAAAIDSLRTAGVARTESWTSRGHPYEEVLARRGFDQKKRTIRFSYRPCRASLADLSGLRDASSAIHLMPGDTDVI